jgi:hypothetical protein
MIHALAHLLGLNLCRTIWWQRRDGTPMVAKECIECGKRYDIRPIKLLYHQYFHREEL